ncbi:AMP-binding protein, partial [Pseudomonas syringae]|uniref:AMP-binding protein n=1 Tax=Pseudomonas syringae TaxID=317 RepID=UPI001E3A9AC5
NRPAGPSLSRASSLPQDVYLPQDVCVSTGVHAGDPLRSVPVGTSLPGASAYVLDDVLNPVGTQVAGELYIGGDSVALGYIGQPA